MLGRPGDKHQFHVHLNPETLNKEADLSILEPSKRDRLPTNSELRALPRKKTLNPGRQVVSTGGDVKWWQARYRGSDKTAQARKMMNGHPWFQLPSTSRH